MIEEAIGLAFEEGRPFAATGALAASRKQLDIIGFLFLASVTGIGGGTLRDDDRRTSPALAFHMSRAEPQYWL